MKTIAILFGVTLLLTFYHVGQNNGKKVQEQTVSSQAELINSLNNRLMASNERRGRVYLALMYSDIKGKEKELDSLLIEIGKDN